MMALNVLANGVNTELKKKIFQSFVRLAVKKKKKSKMDLRKTLTTIRYLIVKDLAN